MIRSTKAQAMKRATAITCLFVDIGGVLLTDGWARESRTLAAKTFDLNPDELENRHHQAFDTYEVGKLSLEDYLNRVVFYQKRSFTRAQFRRFIFAQSKPYPEMIDLIARPEGATIEELEKVSYETSHSVKSLLNYDMRNQVG